MFNLLGITNDLSKGKLLFFIPDKRITSIQIAINNLLTTHYTTVRNLTRFTGKIICTNT